MGHYYYYYYFVSFRIDYEKTPNKLQTVYGEKSPFYLFDPSVPRVIEKQKELDEVKILLFLRNPIDRTYSQFWKHNGKSREIFHDHMTDQIEDLKEIYEKIPKHKENNSWEYVYHQLYKIRPWNSRRDSWWKTEVATPLYSEMLTHWLSNYNNNSNNNNK